MSFTVVFANVLKMLCYAVPGFLLVRARKMSTEHIPSFANLLLYFCSPLQMVYALFKIEMSGYILKHLILALALGILLMGGMIGVTFLAFRKKQEIVAWRIVVAAAAMGNCGFMGIPLIETLLPNYPQGVAFCSTFCMAMNLLMWTVISTIYTHDRKYIKLSNALLNPATVASYIAIALLALRVQIPAEVEDFVSLSGRMATVVSMLVLGMRMAVLPIRPMLTQPIQYLASALKLIVFPLIVLGVCSLLPLEREFVLTIYIMCCMPAGTLVQTFAEILHEGQDTAADVVLLSTLLSLITVPVMMMLV